MSDSEMPGTPSYFLIAVSTRENLELCMKYGLAGFPSGESGAWTFSEIQTGDLVSFLYGAKIHNLYRVGSKEAIRDAQSLPPWKPLFFRETKKTYFFPFRLNLEPIRCLSESVVRAEFAYVAENLLLRGGYSKTHFQADQTTLQSVSQMGTQDTRRPEVLDCGNYTTFQPRFITTKGTSKAPEVTRLRETILQSAIRRYLSNEVKLKRLFAEIGFQELKADELEVLGEKAVPQGHIDILLKKRIPVGSDPKIPIEVKTGNATAKDLAQLLGYSRELRGECPASVLIAREFPKNLSVTARQANVKLVRYSIEALPVTGATFNEICKNLVLRPA